jgi:hypothetical protein
MVQTLWLVLPAGLLAGLAFCVQVFIAIDRNCHSVSDTLYGVFPFFACAFLLFDWIAGRNCETQTIEKQVMSFGLNNKRGICRNLCHYV